MSTLWAPLPLPLPVLIGGVGLLDEGTRPPRLPLSGGVVRPLSPTALRFADGVAAADTATCFSLLPWRLVPCLRSLVALSSALLSAASSS